MLFGDLIDVVEAYAVPVGFAVGLAIGLYSYRRSKNREEARSAPAADGPEERTCPHCKARFADAGDAYCPECRRPLDE